MRILTFEILAVFIAYISVMYALNRRGKLYRYNIRMVGPFVFIHSSHGMNLIEKLARPRKILKFFSTHRKL